MEHTVIDLLLDAGHRGRCRGITAPERGRFHPVSAAKAVILATGGAGRAYKNHEQQLGGAGDGIASAYRAGAERSTWSSSSSIHGDGLAAQRPRAARHGRRAG